jgi:hypothetical protein
VKSRTSTRIKASAHLISFFLECRQQARAVLAPFEYVSRSSRTATRRPHEWIILTQASVSPYRLHAPALQIARFSHCWMRYSFGAVAYFKVCQLQRFTSAPPPARPICPVHNKGEVEDFWVPFPCLSRYQFCSAFMSTPAPKSDMRTADLTYDNLALELAIASHSIRIPISPK